MLSYDTFREENEFHKKQFNNAIAKITDKLFLSKFEATHKYSLYEDSSGNLHIKNNIKNNNDCVTIDKVILCLDDLSDIRQDTIGYITNFSVFKKHVNVLNRVYINNIMLHDILTIIRRFEKLDLIEFKRVTDLEYFIRKSILLGGIVIKRTDIICCLKVSKKLYILSEFNLFVTDKTQFTMENINCEKLYISNLDTGLVTNMSTWFKDCLASKIVLVNFNTERVKNMHAMFLNCSNLIEMDFNSMNTNNVCDFSYMFSGCVNLKEVVMTECGFLKARDLKGMFFSCKSLDRLDLKNWKTPCLENISYFIFGCNNLGYVDINSIVASLGINIFGLCCENFCNCDAKVVIKGSFKPKF